MRIPAFLITIEPCEDGKVIGGNTIVPGSLSPTQVSRHMERKTMVVVPSRADSTNERQDIVNLYRFISLIKQGTVTSSLTTGISDLTP